ncbi:sulfate respiration complex protein HmcD, partial [Planctomycetota bacterium]
MHYYTLQEFFEHTKSTEYLLAVLFLVGFVLLYRFLSEE